MNQTEARAAWVEALRSGVYKQGKNYLHEGDTYCCLGVACDLYRRYESGPGWRDEDTDEDGFPANSYMGEAGVLPATVRDWLGLGDECGCHVVSKVQGRSLSGLNDQGNTFEEIADVIEAAPDGLFTTKEDQ